MNTPLSKLYSVLFLATSLAVTGCNVTAPPPDDSPDPEPETEEVTETEIKIYTPTIGNDLNSKASALLSLNPGGIGGSPNQSLRSGDILVGEDDQDDILIGGLGVDILIGNSGDDILIGGTEDFNSSVDGDGNGSDNRDRAFGNDGDDIFIWAPGDGSDFFDGGQGIDVVVFGKIGEQRNKKGETEGAPFFDVNIPNTEGSQDFDGIFLDENNNPIVDVSGSPGFCSVVNNTEYAYEMDLLNLDHIIRFSLRKFANSFDAYEQRDDDGLRVALSTLNVEYLVCTERVVTENGGEVNIQVMDLTTEPATQVQLSDLPEHVAAIIK